MDQKRDAVRFRRGIHGVEALVVLRNPPFSAFGRLVLDHLHAVEPERKETPHFLRAVIRKPVMQPAERIMRGIQQLPADCKRVLRRVVHALHAQKIRGGIAEAAFDLLKLPERFRTAERMYVRVDPAAHAFGAGYSLQRRR